MSYTPSSFLLETTRSTSSIYCVILGARVIIACRDITKAERAAESIRRSTGHSVTVKTLDLASLESVRRFAENILKTEKNIDILINNAGYLIGLP